MRTLSSALAGSMTEAMLKIAMVNTASVREIDLNMCISFLACCCDLNRGLDQMYLCVLIRKKCSFVLSSSFFRTNAIKPWLGL